MMKILMGAFLLSGAVIQVAAAQDMQRYDLICTGNVSVKAIGQQDPAASPVQEGPFPYSTKLHVDLAQKTFCQDDCRSPQPIFSVQPADIIFELEKGIPEKRFWMARDEGVFFKMWVETGDDRKNKRDLLKSAEGQCVLAVPAITGGPVPSSDKSKLAASAIANVDQKNNYDAARLSRELTSDEISALMDVSNQRAVSPTLITKLHTLGYLHWSGDTLQLTDKGRSIVGGE